MAIYHRYECSTCGYEHVGNPAGFDGTMAGLVIDFRCDHCKEIVNVLMSERMCYVDCPKCGKRVASTWNPIDGNCPKCGGGMAEVPGDCLFMD